MPISEQPYTMRERYSQRQREQLPKRLCTCAGTLPLIFGRVDTRELLIEAAMEIQSLREQLQHLMGKQP